MKIYLVSLLFTLISYPLMSQHQNVKISSENAPEETVILVNHLDVNEIIAGANINNCCRSADGGYSWDCQTLSSPYGVWGDPCIVIDTNGIYNFLSLSNPPNLIGSWIDRIVCQQSSDGGASWDNATFMGLNNEKPQDKEWATVDRNNNNIYVTWTQFDVYGSSAPQDSSIIRFSRSSDGGNTWSEAKRINHVAGDCVDGDNTVEGAVPAVGPNGELYVSWVGPAGMMFDRSMDYGDTWLKDDIFVTDVPGGWDYHVPGFSRCNGLPVLVCDTSGGPNNGTLYINWTDQRNGDLDTDVWLTKSQDGGDTWSAPIRVNDDPPGKHQFLTWVDIDQTNGNLYFVFYDRRDYTDHLTDTYMAWSSNGGITFENFKVSSSPFYPNQNVFMGDYNNVSAHNGVVRPIWTRLHETISGYQLSIWTAIVDLSILLKPEVEHSDFLLSQNFPNPADISTFVKFKLPAATIVTLTIFDLSGKECARPIDHSFYSNGKYVEEIQLNKYGLAKGFYYYELVTEYGSSVKKMIVR
jgi:hypothetical protein